MNLTNGYKSNVLQKARGTYGSSNQISVAIEELCELSCALSKFIRYDTDDAAVLGSISSVIDEIADVTIVLEHVIAIYGIPDTSIHAAQRSKIDRLERWLESGSSMNVTMKDRELDSTDPVQHQDCSDCYYWDHVEESQEACNQCMWENRWHEC